MKRFPDLFRFRFPGNLFRFNFIYQQPVQHPEVHPVQRPVVRRRIQHDLQAPRGGKLHDQRKIVDFILQDQPVSPAEGAENPADMLFRYTPVGSAVKQDAVFPLRTDLNDGMPLGFRNRKQERRIHPVFFQQVFQHRAVRAVTAGMADRGAGPGQGNGLVQAFSAGLDRPGLGGQGFPGLHKMIHLIYVVQVQGTEVQDSHLFSPSRCLQYECLLIMINHFRGPSSSVFLPKRTLDLELALTCKIMDRRK